jgi:mitochondrial fission protein ELM1
MNKTCWIITEGMAGTENQCLGVTDALGLKPEIFQITLKQPWKLFSPYLGFENSLIFSKKLLPPWPDILITSGRKAIAASRYIKKKSLGKTFTIHIQDPRISPDAFDLVALPSHDPTRGKNVIVTCAAPNRITQEKIKQEKDKFSDIFEPLPHPRVAVLIGGNSKAHNMDKEITESLARTLMNLEAGLMITASRRTGHQNFQTLSSTLKGKNIFFWDGQNENPYFGMLGWADYILVTEDSVSMVSDAITTGKPVYIIKLSGGASRLNKFHDRLQKKGITRAFKGELEPYSYKPAADSQLIADEIRKHIEI